MHLFAKAAARVGGMFAGSSARSAEAEESGAEAAPTPRVVVVAHRGGSASAPENTLAAIRRGIALGVDLVELDVQRTWDGKLVIVHDRSLARTTDAERVFPRGAPWNVRDVTYADVRTLDAGSWKGPEFAGERIPTLAEAIRALRLSRSGLLLELKAPELYPGIEAEIVAQLTEFRGYVRSAVAAGRLAVHSFDAESMRRFRRLAPTVPVGLLGAPDLADLPELSTWVNEIHPNHRSVDADYVAQVHRLGMACVVWTVDTRADLIRALDLGVDGIITNHPDDLQALLLERSHRPAAPAA